MPTAAAPTDHRFPCVTCGSDLRFDPARGQLVCDHCGNAEPVGNAPGPFAAVSELDLRQALNATLPATEIEETRVQSCPNCGAQFELQGDTHAAACPFCATPVVTGTGTHRHIKPRGLLPFALDQSRARDAMTDWLGSLWFAPNGLTDYARKGRAMDGIYVPYWTFDAQTESQYTGQRGTYYYTTHTVMRDGKRQTVQQRHTRWRGAAGRVARFFDDVLVLASHSLPKQYTDGLEPWDLSELEPYQPQYLAGFRAEGYQVQLEDGFAEARGYMDRMILRDVKFDIGGDEQRVTDVQTQISAVTFKHILLPIWMAAYKYNGQTYRFVVNGRTGRVQGERPWSKWKIAFAVLVGLVIALTVGYFYAINQ
ncbi:primosomal protein N' (replication factor Y) - superfamily II helicase [Loktanella sp. DJP18]|uniref:primosomal protein N' (replication factor Y) - superfamily II helicase n=1 Tax=Loktanella sp. DJP18 TaxID=3409788 RepID=UPI003BB66F9A